MVKVPRLRLLRERQLLTQQELHEQSGVSVLTIDRMEHGADARDATLRKLASALQVQPSELTGPHGGAVDTNRSPSVPRPPDA
jgi:transcriptional regulator with XRE-family HTH domain